MMPTQSLGPDEILVSTSFPKAGIDRSRSFQRQPNKPVGTPPAYARTTYSALNVRGYEPTLDRLRGGQRGGLARYINATVNGAALTQDLSCIVTHTSPGGSMQSSQSGRVVTTVAVSQGKVFVANAGATAWLATTNHTAFSPELNASGIVYSSANNQKLWFADGSNWCYYVPSTNSVETWTATAGTLPVDSAGNLPRLICTWRGRTVLSGLLYDPQNWFMSKVSDPTDFNYSPLSQTPAQAVAGNNSPLGLVGDVITALIPWSDDVLLFGGDHTLYALRGDPMAGGQLDLVSDTIGVAWGQAWCKDPYGSVFFVSNRMGIYSMVPGQGSPVRISQAIESIVQAVDTGSNTIRLVWDDRSQGLHVFITPTAAAAAATHLFWEARTQSWWQDSFGNDDHNPLCCVTFDGNLPGDRVALIGSWDGYVRYLSSSAVQDDGTDITSSVVIGPLLTKDLDEILLKDMQGILGESSGDVTYAVYVGRTAESALSSTPVATGTWSAGRNLTNFVRRSGYAVYVKLTGTAGTAWQMEAIRCRVASLGKVRRRGR